MHAMARTPDCSMIVYARFDCTLASQSAVYDIDSAVLSVSCQFTTLIRIDVGKAPKVHRSRLGNCKTEYHTRKGRLRKVRASQDIFAIYVRVINFQIISKSFEQKYVQTVQAVET